MRFQSLTEAIRRVDRHPLRDHSPRHRSICGGFGGHGGVLRARTYAHAQAQGVGENNRGRSKPIKPLKIFPIGGSLCLRASEYLQKSNNHGRYILGGGVCLLSERYPCVSEYNLYIKNNQKRFINRDPSHHSNVFNFPQRNLT